jgi:hypothetical protein
MRGRKIQYLSVEQNWLSYSVGNESYNSRRFVDTLTGSYDVVNVIPEKDFHNAVISLMTL